MEQYPSFPWKSFFSHQPLTGICYNNFVRGRWTTVHKVGTESHCSHVRKHCSAAQWETVCRIKQCWGFNSDTTCIPGAFLWASSSLVSWTNPTGSWRTPGTFLGILSQSGFTQKNLICTIQNPSANANSLQGYWAELKYWLDCCIKFPSSPCFFIHLNWMWSKISEINK